MEYIINKKTTPEELLVLSPTGVAISSDGSAFIEANTIKMTMKEMSDQHIIPVWVTTNETLISHLEFIETVYEETLKMFQQHTVLKPCMRVSHPIKGRIPEAKHKAVHELRPWEQTIYYERMMFVIEIPTITHTINGNKLSLMVGGVKSYNLDNLYSKRSQADQRFQLFIGFQNKVCCNMCVWSDGFKEELAIQNNSQLGLATMHLLNKFDSDKQLKALQNFSEVHISESEFAQVIGRARMHKYLPEATKKHIPSVLFGDQQFGSVVKDYYKDSNFGSESGGDISVWDFYNLLTGANKSSYIDAFINRGINAFDFSNGILEHKEKQLPFWYLG